MLNARYATKNFGNFGLTSITWKKNELAVENKASNNSIGNYLSTKNISVPFFFTKCPGFYEKKWKCLVFWKKKKYYGNPIIGTVCGISLQLAHWPKLTEIPQWQNTDCSTRHMKHFLTLHPVPYDRNCTSDKKWYNMICIFFQPFLI